MAPIRTPSIRTASTSVGLPAGTGFADFKGIDLPAQLGESSLPPCGLDSTFRTLYLSTSIRKMRLQPSQEGNVPAIAYDCVLPLLFAVGLVFRMAT